MTLIISFTIPARSVQTNKPNYNKLHQTCVNRVLSLLQVYNNQALTRCGYQAWTKSAIVSNMFSVVNIVSTLQRVTWDLAEYGLDYKKWEIRPLRVFGAPQPPPAAAAAGLPPMRNNPAFVP